MSFSAMLLLAPVLLGSGSEVREVWLAHNRAHLLADPSVEWPEVRSKLHALQVGINAPAYLIPQDAMRALLDLASADGIRIAVECGYFDWLSRSDDFRAPNPKPIAEYVPDRLRSGVGARTARTEMAKLAVMTDLGRAPDYLVLDGPVRRLLYPGADRGRGEYRGPQEGLASVEAAAAEVAAYMRAWREAYPGVQFIVLTNFPNWGWKGRPAYWASGPGDMYWGDYHEVLSALLDRLETEGLRPAGVRADNPYEYTLGEMPVPLPHYPEPSRQPGDTDWLARLLDLEAFVKSRGYPFDVIFNSKKGGHESDEAFSRRTLAFIDLYGGHGGRAHRYVIQTWYEHPSEVGPETTPYTLTHLIREVFARVRP